MQGLRPCQDRASVRVPRLQIPVRKRTDYRVACLLPPLLRRRVHRALAEAEWQQPDLSCQDHRPFAATLFIQRLHTIHFHSLIVSKTTGPVRRCCCGRRGLSALASIGAANAELSILRRDIHGDYARVAEIEYDKKRLGIFVMRWDVDSTALYGL